MADAKKRGDKLGAKSKGKGSVASADSDDPRRPALVTKLELALPGEEKPQDYMILVAFLFGFLGLILKYRIFVLQSAFCCVMSFANMRYADYDFKQGISLALISVMGLFMAYLGPQARMFY